MKISNLYGKVFLILGIGGLLFRFFLQNLSWLIIWNIFKITKHKIDFLIVIDWVSIVFFSVLCVIVGCVLKFSCVYMDGDKKEYRFLLLVLSFVLSMTFLIFVPHFIMLLLGWDGLGLTSFLLVVYYSSSSSWRAGLKTYLVNRLGDSFLVLCIVLLFSQGHWKILAYDKILFWRITFLFVFGAFTKSAQYPFSSWLPAAMAAPTPVSALVHSSTLVTAGIYLLIRFNYSLPFYVHLIVGLVGLWTLYAARMAACVEWDAKKVIAYSTLSQLGLMCFSLGLGLRLFAFFHLLTHAVFKALLFICVGYWISQNKHLQDLRGLKNLWLQNPLCSLSMMIRILALSGFPFLAGFYSKDIILESNLYLRNKFFYWIFLFSLPLTSFYSFRLFFWLLQTKRKIVVQGSKENSVYLFSVLPLVFSSIVLGCFLRKKIFIRVFPRFLFKFLILFLIVIGFFCSFLSRFRFRLWLNWFSRKIFYVVPLNSSLWLRSFRNIGRFLYVFLDHGWGSQLTRQIKNYIGVVRSNINRYFVYFSTPNFFFYVGVIVLMVRIIQINIF